MKCLSKPKGIKHRGVSLALPDVSEQQEIAKVLGACDNKIAALESESFALEELFHTLLEELMIGRLSALSLIKDER